MTMTERESWYDFWGKTDRRSKADLPPYHLLAYHNLDVAAAGQVILKEDVLLRRRLAGALDMDEDRLISFVTFLFALHDIGKFAEDFQGYLQSKLFETLRKRGTRSTSYHVRHDTLGYLFWRDVLHSVTWEVESDTADCTTWVAYVHWDGHALPPVLTP